MMGAQIRKVSMAAPMGPLMNGHFYKRLAGVFNQQTYPKSSWDTLMGLIQCILLLPIRAY